MFDRWLKTLPDKENLTKQKSGKSIERDKATLPFLSGDVARIINASIDPPRNGGSSSYR